MIIRTEVPAEVVTTTENIIETSKVTEVAKQDGNKFVPNPTGKGGFLDRPENINRKGRPKKGLTMTDIAKDILEEELPSGMTRKEALMRKIATLAYEGNETMIKMIWNYVDGMPVSKDTTSMFQFNNSNIQVISYKDLPKDDAPLPLPSERLPAPTA
jgi:hypothetical protein